MRVTGRLEECTLEMADRTEREWKTIRKVCEERRGWTGFSPGIERWPEV